MERTISTSKSATKTTPSAYLNGTAVADVDIGGTNESAINAAAKASADSNDSISSSGTPEQEDETASRQGQNNFDMSLADNAGCIENNFQEFPNEPG
ncbi:unnamed protein product [Schistocephalus solidus]|uniref:Uncharacterized protein n=1 Tax=Schistocephalus solidus TaxID=70667 RepID=A0A183SDZ5_SCHSO|nr:unnamed protein product [Schistocephalus solidus]